MKLAHNILDLAWNYGPQRVATIAGDTALLRYQSSFIRTGTPFRCWWMREPLPGNLGDLLTPIIIDRLFHRMPVFCPRRSFLGVGSTISKARAGTTVWGSGLSSADREDHPGARYIAVRGPLTRNVLRHRGRNVPDIYGDPAILMPFAYMTDVRTTHELGLVPHHTHLPRVKNLPQGVALINLLVGSVEDIFNRIDQIAQCEIIASSSLHGLVLGLAYGRKVVWLRDPTAPLRSDTFKFKDFFASIGVHTVEPTEWSPSNPAPSALKRYAISAHIPDSMAPRLADALNEFIADH